MKLFQSICRFYQVVGIQPPQLNQNYSFRWMHLICVFFLIQLICTTVAFILFEAKSIVEYAEAFFPASTEIANMVNFIVCIFKITNIFQLIENFEKFIEKSEFYSQHTQFNQCFPSNKLKFLKKKTITESHNHPDLMAMYNMIAAKFERLSNLGYLIIVKFTMVSFVLPPLAITGVNYFIYDLGNESYVLPYRILYVLKRQPSTVPLAKFCSCFFRFRLPFNWRTPLGYLMALILQAASTYVTLLSVSPSIILLVGSCWILILFIHDITNDLSKLSAIKHDQLLSSGKNTNGKIKRRFCKIVRNFSDVKELSVGKRYICCKRIN